MYLGCLYAFVFFAMQWFGTIEQLKIRNFHRMLPQIVYDLTKDTALNIAAIKSIVIIVLIYR